MPKDMNDDGIRIKYSPVNQAWFVMWHDSVLRIFNDPKDAKLFVDELHRDGIPEDIVLDILEEQQRR